MKRTGAQLGIYLGGGPNNLELVISLLAAWHEISCRGGPRGGTVVPPFARAANFFETLSF